MEDLLVKGSLADIQQALVGRRLSVREIADWYIRRIKIHDGPTGLNAVRVLSDRVFDDAAVLDEELSAGRSRGPLHGIPILLKDNISTGDGMPTTAGAVALRDFVPRCDATIVARMRHAGALILGKTNLTEFADYVSDHMPSGFSGIGGVVKNPHTKAEYGRGLGSSVGSAASVAASFAPIAIGSETQNSIQTPASVSSVFGFKPSVGSVSRSGIVPLVPSQDSPGPLARSVQDIVCLMSVIGGGDCHDSATLVGLERRAPGSGRKPENIRIGVLRRTITDRDDLRSAMPLYETVLATLAKSGMKVIDPCDLPSAEQLQEVRSRVFRTEFKASLDAFLTENGQPCGIDSLDALIRWNERNPSAIPYGQSLLKAASETNGLSDPAYVADRRRDIALSRQAGIDAALYISQADVLIAPMGSASKYTGKAGAPTLSIPAGLDAKGAPFGVTIFASIGHDRTVLEVGDTIAATIGNRIQPTL